jgi:hypothetical protein
MALSMYILGVGRQMYKHTTRSCDTNVAVFLYSHPEATVEELLEAVFSVQSMPRCYKQDKS